MAKRPGQVSLQVPATSVLMATMSGATGMKKKYPGKARKRQSAQISKSRMAPSRSPFGGARHVLVPNSLRNSQMHLQSERHESHATAASKTVTPT